MWWRSFLQLSSKLKRILEMPKRVFGGPYTASFLAHGDPMSWSAFNRYVIPGNSTLTKTCPRKTHLSSGTRCPAWYWFPLSSCQSPMMSSSQGAIEPGRASATELCRLEKKGAFSRPFWWRTLAIWCHMMPYDASCFFFFGDFGDVSWIRHLVSLKPTVEGENLPSISGHLRMGWITT